MKKKKILKFRAAEMLGTRNIDMVAYCEDNIVNSLDETLGRDAVVFRSLQILGYNNILGIVGDIRRK